MSDKQKAIEKAYGEHWEIVKDIVDENGWINNNLYKFTFGDLNGLESEYKNDIYFRPKSLQGIETNNGWIKIESEEQYDQLENGEYEWYNIENGRYDKSDLYSYGVFTHYKVVPPKVKPKPPIY